MPTLIQKISYRGWPNCWRLSNGLIEAVVTADVGPRVIRFGFAGGPNEFKEVAATLGLRGGRAWRSYGGHRLWHAPEDRKLSYIPDNSPVAVELIKGGLRFVQDTEKASGLRKEMELFMGAGPKLQVAYRLRNMGKRPSPRAPWVLTVMAAGGRAIVPLPPYAPHPQKLWSQQHLVLWPFTEMNDPRWTWGNKYIQLRQDRRRSRSQKVGLAGPGNWAAYLRRGHLFIKKFKSLAGQPYPDRGCSTEIFTDSEMLELESLAPLVPIQPGKAALHVEDWHLFRAVPAFRDDAGIDRHLVPRLRSCR